VQQVLAPRFAPARSARTHAVLLAKAGTRLTATLHMVGCAAGYRPFLSPN